MIRMFFRFLFPVLTCFLLVNAVIAAPAAPVAISPLEEVLTPTPDFVWQDQASVTQYRLYVYDRSQRQRLHLQNYNQSDICADGVCSVTPDIALQFSKNHRWFVRARDSGGWSSWTKISFDYVDSVPLIVTTISPTGVATSATPEFQWNDLGNATKYRLYVRNVRTLTNLLVQDYPSDEVCNNGICTITPDNISLPESDYLFFRVRGYNSAGWGPYSTIRRFSYALPDQPPIATNDSATVLAGEAISINVLVNDSDPDGSLDNNSVTVTSQPGQGLLAVQNDGTILYTHDGGIVLADSFIYTVEDNDGLTSNPATVSITITPTPNQAPIAANDTTSVIAGNTVTINVLDNDSDTDGSLDNTSVTITVQPTRGSVSVQNDGTVLYAQDGETVATDNFSYTVDDNEGRTSNPASVNITIVDSGVNQPPEVGNDTAIVAEGGQVIIDVLANDQDLDGTINIGSLDISQPSDGTYYPANGTVQLLSGGRISYTHYGGPTTSDVFYYVVADNDGAYSVPGVVSISTGVEPSNQPPLASNDTATVTSEQSVVIDILSNDIDPDGAVVPGSVIAQQGTHGLVEVMANGTIQYSHDGSPATSDSFTYTVSDDTGEASNIATVTIAITTGNQAPVANNDSVQLLSEATIIIDALSNDADPDGNLNPATITITDQPGSAASLTIQSDGQIRYTNNGDGNSTDIFSYTVKDNNNETSNPATVNLSILPIIADGTLTAFHRSGQSFLTWEETGTFNGYHVYRHNSPISAANLSDAVKLTNKWGPLDYNTSVNIHGGPNVPRNFVISDLAAPLDDNTGLFVYTTQPGDSTTAYYAVTSVDNTGTEMINTVLKTDSPLPESVTTPSDVLTSTMNQGKGRTYTQYMDYTNWNPTFNGYAYNYAVALPANYNSANAYPLMIELHAYYETFKSLPESQYQWPVITLLPHDPGPTVGALHSWWYGYSRDHNYKTNGSIPETGAIANFTEQRLMRSIDDVIGNPAFNVDTNRIHGYGNSMGASGVLSLALRYASLLSGVYANQPMTNYRTSPIFESELIQLWGQKAANLPIVNGGPHGEDIALYGSNGIVNVGVWDWMNHHKQLVDRRGDTFAYVMTYHGKQDTIIDWTTQGRPTVEALTNATTGFSAVNDGDAGHTWAGFASVSIPLFGFGYDDDFAWKYPLNLSYPAITNASASSNVVPENYGNDNYNINIEWATAHTPFAAEIVDLPGQYSISLRSLSGVQTAAITPRRTQQFAPDPGTQCTWVTTDNNTGLNLSSGSVTVDLDSLVTVSGTTIAAGSGTRLSIDCP